MNTATTSKETNDAIRKLCKVGFDHTNFWYCRVLPGRKPAKPLAVLNPEGFLNTAFYDRSLRAWTCTVRTVAGDQVGDSIYETDKTLVWRWILTGSFRKEGAK